MSSEEKPQILGEGRSGIVLRRGNAAIKIFTGGDSLTKLVNYFVFGAPGAYIWNEDAVWAAHYKREILPVLVEHWFGDKLRVARSKGVEWNDDFKAYELHTEFVDGRPASLHHPYSKPREGELSDLVDNVMKPLQERLIEAGFDGSVWQAGKGNPVASNNFLLEDKVDGECKWAWIDIESGVPALFPLNPISLFSFYIPKAIKHRHPLFDDVDIIKLRDYIEEEREILSPERYSSLSENLVHLAEHQKRWKSMRRVDRSIDYRFKKGEINERQKDFYSRYPLIWYGKEGAKALWKGYDKLLGDLPWRAFDKLTTIDYRKKISNFVRFISSEQYREELARDHVRERIDEWGEKDMLDCHEVEHLSKQLEVESTSPYLTDLYVHASLKVFDWGMFPSILGILYFNDMISVSELAVLAYWGGSITRTTYTGSRMLYSVTSLENLRNTPKNIIKFKDYIYQTIGFYGLITGLMKISDKISRKIINSERSIAFVVGLFPQFGNMAYPVQMIYSADTRDKEIGKFMLYDLFSRIGEKVPIWGGENTRTQHWFNHIPDLIVRDRRMPDPL